MAQGLVAPHFNVWPGKITQIIDPHNFWMHFATNELLKQFELLQREIQHFCKKNWTHVGDSDHLDYGQVVLIDTGEQDGIQFKRGQVTRLTSTNSVDVFYVDYGLTELKTTDCICVNFPQNFKKWPPQAVRCSLAGILHIGKNWTTRATKTFQKITDGKMFKTLVLYGQPGFCEVSLYPSESDNGRSVSHSLLDEDVAMPAEGKEVPEYFSEIMEFLAALMPADMAASLDTREERKSQESEATTNLPSTPIDRYVPPQRKNMDFSLSTSFVPRDTSSSNRSGRSDSGDMIHVSTAAHDSTKSHTPQKHSPRGMHVNTSLGKQKPVNDFFPFENVSTYPPTPTSPMKPPVKAVTTHSVSSSPETSYFSRPPSKQDSVNMSPVSQQHYSPTSRVDPGRYSVQQERKQHRHHDHRFVANLNNLPSPGRQDAMEPSVSSIGTSLIDGQNAAANLEPSYLNTAISDQKDHYQGLSRSPKSPSNSQNASSQHYGFDSKSQMETSRVPNHAPFYPPSPQHGDSIKTGMNQQSYNAQSHVKLVPPGFFASPHHQNLDNQGEAYRSPKSSYTSAGYGNGPNTGYRKNDHHDQYYNHGNSHVYNHHNNSGNNYENQYSKQGGYQSPQKYTKSNRQSDYNDQYIDHSSSVVSNTNNSYYNNQTRPQLKVKLPETPARQSSFEKKGKVSPASPDSAPIGDFNFGDIDNAADSSIDYYHKKVRDEKLMALQEEAEDIAAESEEQARLVEMARYGAVAENHQYGDREDESSDIFKQIAEEITSATSNSKEFEDLKRSPIKRNKTSDDGSYVPPKLESIPSQYIADIDFAEAIKETLEFSKTEGLENAKILLDGIVESMKMANVEKQLYDVLMLMLAKAVKDYDLFHQLILDAVCLLNDEMEVVECLTKVLKRQQELWIRTPVHQNQYHLNCSRIMAHVFLMSHGWSDSNSTIQDAILLTVERWILFNNKGTQTGQTLKENLFLDCFGAFWEVAGNKLMSQNFSFRTRIHDEIKKKLLNENVSRPVRERLLDILLELFSGCLDTVSVHTQTVNRTMIPSSCQVKPSLSSKGTMTYFAEFEDNDYMIDDYNQRWKFLSSLPSTCDTNEISDISRSPSKPRDSIKDSDNMTDSSYQSSNADISVYATPNTSLNVESDIKVERSGNLFSDAASALKEDVPGAKISPNLTGASAGSKKTEKSSSNYSKNTKTVTSSPRKKTVFDEKSAECRSIVDWFDYEPANEMSAEINKRDRVKVNVEHNDAGVSVDKSECESPEKPKKQQTNGSPDMTYPETGQKMGKSAKSKRNRKGKKSSPNKDSVTSSPEKESESVTEKRLSESNVDDGSRSVDAGDISVEDNLQKSNKDLDWWGRDDPAIVIGNVYVDNGPDVIIEGDEEEIERIHTTSSFSSNGPLIDEPQADDTKSKGDDEFTLLANNVGVSETEVSIEELMDKGIQKMDDEYAFETDSDNDFDDDQDFAAINLDKDFQQTNLKERVLPPPPNSNATVFINDNSYDKDFPTSDLASYFPALQDEPVSQPKARWVPRKRVCLNCHDDGHTTDACPKGFLLLQ